LFSDPFSLVKTLVFFFFFSLLSVFHTQKKAMWILILGAPLVFIGGALLTIVGQQSLASTYATTRPPLTDRLHRPEWEEYSKYYTTCDLLAPSLIPFMIVHFLLYRDWVLIVSYLWTQGVLFALRPVFFWPTTLPNCSPIPPKQGYNDLSPFTVLWKYATLQDPHHGHQSDLVFSGHTSSLFVHVFLLNQFALDVSPELSMFTCLVAVSVLIWLLNASTNGYWAIPVLLCIFFSTFVSVPGMGFAVVLWLYALSVALAIVVTRCHYTLCVVASVPVAYMVCRLVAFPVAIACGKSFARKSFSS